MITEQSIKENFPLHWSIWSNDLQGLKDGLLSEGVEVEKKDVRGRTPLMLAITLGRLEMTQELIRHGTNVNTENKEGWTAVQEAVATGDLDLVAQVLERRDFQRHSSRIGGVPELLRKLKEAPDFYVEMKWEFTSWVPLVSRMCPSDTYKVYKQGSKVRIDTTLLGFDQTDWHRGNTSYIFHGQTDTATMMEVDHETHEVFVEQMEMPANIELGGMFPSNSSVLTRLRSPIVTTYVDTENISFERNKSGIWGWRSDKSEDVNGYSCKVFSCNNVALVTKTRTEHLSEKDKIQSKMPRTPLHSFLGIAQNEQVQVQGQPEPGSSSDTNSEEEVIKGNPCNITALEYFDPEVDLGGRDIGRPKEMASRTQKFRATLWLCEDYPLALQEQIMPIVDLMAISSPHFAKLKDFIQMQLPAGFPVKIEIPLFHVLNARITFGNIYGMDQPVDGVTFINEDAWRGCVVDDSVFNAPASYARIGSASRRQPNLEEEDELLQFAIQQSIIGSGNERDEVDIWEALRAAPPQRPTTPLLLGEEERQLQRAIQASLLEDISRSDAEREPVHFVDGPPRTPDDDSDLQAAIALSRLQEEEDERRRKEEEEMLQEVLRLSVTDK
ncbi:ankyrin repeat domain-containing protein 13D [Thrips palmi]|uniref:Ankyrin repeat domain-containing protein 13D n=1 Tax=Thrips palmi TaxID=161013 RepID=A0A6P9A3G8_THRPL|nr:ankyrin repeat domain-containing protein 13D [Thrips palmi]XP_034252443.1 ankyrin repeat domain-containing protein 13D [Thrips palmi]